MLFDVAILMQVQWVLPSGTRVLMRGPVFETCRMVSEQAGGPG